MNSRNEERNGVVKMQRRRTSKEKYKKKTGEQIEPKEKER